MASNPKLTGKEKSAADASKVAPRTSADDAADYQWSIALLNSNPDVRKVFRSAVSNGWEPARFTAELMKTDWFRQNAASWRQSETQRITDPATWEAGRKARQADIQDQARSMGAVLSDKQLAKVSDNSISFGWNQSQTNDALASYVHVVSSGTLKGQYTGDAGKTYTELQRQARANGYSMSDKQAKDWLTNIAAGNATADNYADNMRGWAAGAYPVFADELHSGQNLSDLMGSYQKSMGDLLEIDPNNIGMNDKLLRTAMSAKDAKGKPTTMPMADFEDKVRADSRWQYTDNAHQQVMGQVLNVGQMFGLTG